MIVLIPLALIALIVALPSIERWIERLIVRRRERKLRVVGEARRYTPPEER